MTTAYKYYEEAVTRKYQKEWDRLKTIIPTFQQREYAEKLKSAMQDELMLMRKTEDYSNASTPVKLLTEYDLAMYKSYPYIPNNAYINYYAGIDPANLPNTHISECDRSKINKPSKILLLCH